MTAGAPPQPQGEPTAVVMRPAEIAVRERGGGIRTTPLVTPGHGSTILTGITELDPGAAVPLHWHNCAESVIVLSGAAIALIGGADYPLEPGDSTLIRAGVRHGSEIRRPSRRCASFGLTPRSTPLAPLPRQA